MDHERTISLPDALLDQYRQGECAVFSGLLPSISRAWVSIDDCLFLWNYDDGRDFCVYDGVDQVIVSVGLVRAKPSLFVDQVRYLLLIATPVEVIALAVSFAQDLINGELTLHPTGLSVPSDNVHMVAMAGTADGRAFMAGNDGALYELAYSADNGWLAQRPMKCRKMNRSASLLGALVPTFLRYFYFADDPLIDVASDCSRGLLYTLAASSRIEVRVVGAAHDSDAAQRSSSAAIANVVASMSGRELQSAMADMCSHVTSDDKRLVALHAVPLSESGHVHLIGVTARGTRLYFTTHRVHSYTTADDGVNEPAKTLTLVHVRVPPSGTPALATALVQSAAALAAANGEDEAAAAAAAASSEQRRVLPCYASSSAFVLPVVGASNQSDSLLMTLPGAAAAESGSDGARCPFRETQSTVALDARVFAIAQQPLPPIADPYLAAATHAPTLFALDRMTESAATRAQTHWSELASSALADAPTGVPLGSALARNRYAVAHLLPPRRVLCLSGTGLTVMRERRPVDVLRALLLATRGNETRELREFFAVHGTAEACAMCLLLATSPPPSGASISIGNRHAGTPPSLLQHIGPLQGTRPHSAALVEAALNAVGRLGGAAVLQRQASNGGGAARGEAAVGRAVLEHAVQYGGAHDGLALYLARRLRPVWQYAVAVQHVASVGAHSNTAVLSDAMRQFADAADDTQQRQHQQHIVSRLDIAALQRVEQPLVALQTLLDTHPQLCGGGRGPAAAAEARSFAGMRAVLAAAIDTLSFWRSLCENDFALLAQRLAPVARTELLATRFRDLVRIDHQLRGVLDGGDDAANDERRRAQAEQAQQQGSNVGRLLLNELIALHAERGSNVDFLSEQLRERCPSMFAEADRVRFKAHEMLQLARNTAEPQQRQRLASQAVERLSAVAGSVNLPAVTKSLLAMDCASGALEVVLAYTRDIDPNRLALALHYSGGGAGTAEVAAVAAAGGGALQTPGRAGGNGGGGSGGGDAHTLHKYSLAAYSYVLDAAEELVAKRADSSDRAAAARAGDAFEELKRTAASSDDELFHVCFYDWFAQVRDGELVPELLELQTPYLENYLKSTSLDLLCRYYVRNGRMQPAAVILTKLAERRDSQMPLERRIENLARAKGCLGRAVGAQSDATLGLHVHEKLDVARLQLRVRDRLLERQSVGESDDELKRAIDELNGELFAISDLYNRYAKRFRLRAEQLALLHCAGHGDRQVSCKVWTQLVRSFVAKRDSIAVIANKVAALGRDYYPSDITFPLSHIALLLERHSLRVFAAEAARAAGAPPPDALLWAARALHAGGAAWPALYSVYDELVTQAETDTALAAEQGLHLHTLRVVALLLDQWLSQERNARATIARYHLAEALERYAVVLSSVAPSQINALHMSEAELGQTNQLLKKWMH